MATGGWFLTRRRHRRCEPDRDACVTPRWLDLSGAVAQAAAERMDWAHVVVYIDHVTGCVNAAGPFVDVVEACGFATRIGDELGLHQVGGVTVVPLHPADR